MKAIFELINPDNTLSVNRRLAHAVGLQEAVVYSALLAKYAWYESHDMLAEGGWFYSTAEDLEESTALTRCQQQRCISSLTSAGLICCNVMGMPAKRYFRIVDDVSILKGLFSSVESKPEEVRRESGENEKQDPIKPESKFAENHETSFKESLNKTKDNKTKENKPEENKQDRARTQIRHAELSAKYGAGFADLAAEVVAEGISDGTDGQDDSPESVSYLFSRVDYDTVCHVADYISSRKCDIRNMRAYLRSALCKAVGESAQKPQSAAGEYSGDSTREPHASKQIIPGVTEEDILAELRAQYAT